MQNKILALQVSKLLFAFFVRLAEGYEEHDAFVGSMRGEEVGYFVVEEGEAGGAGYEQVFCM